MENSLKTEVPGARETEDLVRKSAPAPATWLIALAIAAFAALYLFQFRHDLLYQWLEDLQVYSRATAIFRAGGNPYTTQIFEGLRFVYPPIVLLVFSGLASVLPGGSEWLVFAFLHLTSVLLAPFVLARYYLREKWLTPAMAFLVWLSESRFTGMLALYSANVVPTLYLAALLAAVPGLRRNRWGWFYLVVFLAGTVKITFVVMLLLPILAATRQWLRSIACLGCVAAVYELEAKLCPVLYAGYKFAVVQQVQVESQFGYGVFGVIASLLQKLHRPVALGAYAAHGIFALVLLGLLLALKQRGAEARDRNLWLGLVLMAVIVINPRILHYDAYLALFAAYFVLALTLNLGGWKLVALTAILFAPSLLVPHILHTKLMYGMYELLLILVALSAGMRQLWRATSRPAVALKDEAEILPTTGVQSVS